METVNALSIREESAIMSSQNRVLFVKYLLTRRLSLEKAVLFLIFDSVILVHFISGWYQEKTSSADRRRISGSSLFLWPQEGIAGESIHNRALLFHRVSSLLDQILRTIHPAGNLP